MPKLTGFTPFKVEAVDAETCEIATFRVSRSQLVSVRLKVDGAGATSQIDILQAVSGDQFFRPAGFPNTTPAIITSAQRPGPPPNIPAAWTEAAGTPKEAVNATSCKAGKGAARKLTRRELVYVASTYADGLRGKPWDQCLIGTGSCPRVENGVQTTPNCAVGAGMFRFNVQGRRWVADTETGVVLGIFYFDLSAYGALASAAGFNLFLHEYIKVDRGGLAYIYAPMKNLAAAQAKAKLWPN
jgi:hypothetical protein